MFTTTVGVLLLINWLGVFTELWGVNTGVWLALIVGEYLKRLNEEITGIAVSDLKLTGEAGAVLRAEFVYRGKNEAQQYHLVLRDGAWKIDRVDESERIKTLIPYGSDATGSGRVNSE